MASRLHGLPAAARALLVPSLLFAVLGAALDVAQWLRATPLWVDEEMIALNLRDRPLIDLAGALWLGQSAPLGWLVVQRGVLDVFGRTELSLRLVPLLCGVALLVGAAWVGERWLHRIAAAFLVVICAMGEWLSHYRFELKHYSADILFGLLVPAVAAWVLDEDDDERQVRRRWIRWWLVAAGSQWIANGALLVAPACALVLFVALLGRHGLRHALYFASAGAIWATSVALHYALSLQYTHYSAHLRGYWAPHVPPDSLGPLGIAAWIAERLPGIADNPGGTTAGITLWMCALFGFAMTRRRALAAMFASVPLAAFALAALRLVPFNDRLAVWIVPALYVGVALLLDAGLRLLLDGWRSRRWRAVLPGAAAILFAAFAGGDIVDQGRRNLDLGNPIDNHAVDDRSAAAWVIARRRPGDVLLSTPLGWPALWWYGGISLRRPAPAGLLHDGSVMYQVTHQDARIGCGGGLVSAVRNRRRVLVHVGFPDTSPEFYDLLMKELTALGRIVEQAEFSFLSRTALVELRPPGEPPDAVAPSIPEENGAEGCVGVAVARRW